MSHPLPQTHGLPLPPTPTTPTTTFYIPSLKPRGEWNHTTNAFYQIRHLAAVAENDLLAACKSHREKDFYIQEKQNECNKLNRELAQTKADLEVALQRGAELAEAHTVTEERLSQVQSTLYWTNCVQKFDQQQRFLLDETVCKLGFDNSALQSELAAALSSCDSLKKKHQTEYDVHKNTLRKLAFERTSATALHDWKERQRCQISQLEEDKRDIQSRLDVAEQQEARLESDLESERVHSARRKSTLDKREEELEEAHNARVCLGTALAKAEEDAKNAENRNFQIMEEKKLNEQSFLGKQQELEKQFLKEKEGLEEEVKRQLKKQFSHEKGELEEQLREARDKLEVERREKDELQREIDHRDAEEDRKDKEAIRKQEQEIEEKRRRLNERKTKKRSASDGLEKSRSKFPRVGEA